MRPPTRLVVNRATVTSSTIGFHWQQVDGTLGYRIRVSPRVPDLDLNQLILETEFVLRGLSPDILYIIQVAAVNIAGDSRYTMVSQKTLSMCFAQANQYEEHTFSVICPAGCARHRNSVYGTRIYTLDSYICSAAIHDGRIDNELGGTVMVRRTLGINDFVGTLMHGIVSQDYGSYHDAFVFALQPPQNIRIKPGSVSSDSFIVQWDLVRGADAYRVRTSPSAVGDEGNIVETEVLLHSMAPNVTYTVQVEAVNERETSEEGAVTQRTALPGTARVTVDNVAQNSFLVSWLPVPGASSYRVNASLYERLVFTIQTTAHEVLVNSLASGTVYNVTVQSINHISIGSPTTIQQFTGLDVPSNLRVLSLGSDNMVISWLPVNGAAYYSISYSKDVLDTCCMTNLTIYENRVLLSELLPNQLYVVQITASNQFSTSRRAMLRQVTALPQPPNLRVVNGSLTQNSVFLSWDELPDVRTYIISELNDTRRRSFNTSRHTIKLQSLYPRRTYRIQVIGYSIHHISGDPSIVEFTTLIEPPENLRVETANNNNQVNVKWNPVVGATLYLVTCNPSEGVIGTGELLQRNVILSGLQFRVLYNVSVAAMVGTKSGMKSYVSFTLGVSVMGLVAVHNVTRTSMLLQWNHDDIAVTRLQYNMAGSSNRLSIASNRSMSEISIHGMQPYTRYNLVVTYEHLFTSLHNNQQNQEPISTAVVTRNLNDTSDEVILMWNQVPGATSYSVTSIPGYRITGLRNYTATTATLTGFRRGTNYMISVIAWTEETSIQYLPATVSIEGIVPDYPEPSVITVEPTIDNYENSATGDTVFNTEVNPNGNSNNNNNNQGQTGNESVQQNNVTWIAILVVVGLLFTMFVVLVTVCICAGENRKPLFRNCGCCWCCRCASGVKSCSCRGCCCEDDQYRGSYY
nr:fibronectin [Ciona intestinalis]|eukprot:XP_009862031.2 fibronectin [Ciona intestinalis]